MIRPQFLLSYVEQESRVSDLDNSIDSLRHPHRLLDISTRVRVGLRCTPEPVKIMCTRLASRRVSPIVHMNSRPMLVILLASRNIMFTSICPLPETIYSAVLANFHVTRLADGHHTRTPLLRPDKKSRITKLKRLSSPPGQVPASDT